MEFALMAKVMLQGACLCEADMSGAQLDAISIGEVQSSTVAGQTLATTVRAGKEAPRIGDFLERHMHPELDDLQQQA